MITSGTVSRKRFIKQKLNWGSWREGGGVLLNNGEVRCVCLSSDIFFIKKTTFLKSARKILGTTQENKHKHTTPTKKEN